MVKKIIALVLILLICTLLGDANPNFTRNRFTYVGESPSWRAVFAADETGVFTENEKGLSYQSRSNDLLTVTYKKDPAGLSSIRSIWIDYKPESGSFSGYLSEDYSDGPGAQKIYRLGIGGGGGSLLKENAVIIVTIATDSAVEMMQLRNPAVN